MRFHLLPLALSLWALATGCSTAPTAARTDALAAASSRFELPETDAVLPGSGPFRRADWFQSVWRERREQFASRAAAERGALVFLGDSITQGWGDELGRAFGGARVANRGISGDTSRGVLYRLPEDVIALQPRGVVLLIGTNDIEERATPDTIAQNVRLIVDALAAAQPRMPIFLCEVLPSSTSMRRPTTTIQELNRLYAAIAAEHPQVTLVKTWAPFANAQGDARPEEFPDLLHLNEAGYARWAEILRPLLTRARLL